MGRQELATYLRSRRERVQPGDVGLLAGPRRRTPGLRRDEVALLAHISTEYYARLEQGRAARPSHEVLAAIADALRLSSAEAAHLHTLVGDVASASRVHRRDVRPSILALLERVPHTAAFVMSAAFEVLAWNSLAAALMEDFGPLPTAERNLARKAFSDDVAAGLLPYGISDIAPFQQTAVMALRGSAGRYPGDPVLAGLITELRASSAEFARLWARHDVDAPPSLTKTFCHPVVGPITLDCDLLKLDDRDQHLVMYTAPQESPAARRLALLDVAPRRA